MTAILTHPSNPCIQRSITRGAATFECREYPLHVARHRSVIENRMPDVVQGRDERGRFGAMVFA